MSEPAELPASKDIRVGAYRLLQPIVRGSVADVYEALHEGKGEGQHVAIKLFKGTYARQESLRAYVLKELARIASFEHPSLLPVLDYGFVEDTLFIVQPLMTNGTLEDLLQRVGGRFSAIQAVPIMQQLCSAVHYLHEQQSVHGNIKPSNVFVTVAGQMILSDLGFLRSDENSQQSLTRVSSDSAAYTAPEQSLGVLWRTSDIYALGAVLFYLLTGTPPFTGATPADVLLQHVRQPVPSLKSKAPEISPAVEAVVQKALQKRVEERYRSVEELATALSAAVHVAPTASPLARKFAVPSRLSRLASDAGEPPTAVEPVARPTIPLQSDNTEVQEETVSIGPTESSPLPTPTPLSSEASPATLEAVAVYLRKTALLPETAQEEVHVQSDKPSRTLAQSVKHWLPLIVMALLLLLLLVALCSAFLFPGS